MQVLAWAGPSIFFRDEITKILQWHQLTTNVLRTQWQGRSETIGEYGRHMERLAGSVSPGFGSEFSFS